MTDDDLASLAEAEDRLGAERRLALLYCSREKRPSLRALWLLDAALGAVVAAGGQPMVRQLKFAWWRDALTRLDTHPAPPEPVLKAVAEHVLPTGISGETISGLASGWEVLVTDDVLSDEELRQYAQLRGGLLFSCSAKILGTDPLPGVGAEGERWALVDLARHSSRSEEGTAALRAAGTRAKLDGRWPRGLRPLGMLAMLARRDAGGTPIEGEGAPARLFRMLVHRLTGR